MKKGEKIIISSPVGGPIANFRRKQSALFLLLFNWEKSFVNYSFTFKKNIAKTKVGDGKLEREKNRNGLGREKSICAITK